MTTSKFFSEDAILVLVIYFVVLYFVADYLFSFLWNNGFKASRKKVYLTEMMATTSSVTFVHNSNESPFYQRDASPIISENHSHQLDGGSKGSQGTSKGISKGISHSDRRSSRHGIFGEDSDDEKYEKHEKYQDKSKIKNLSQPRSYSALMIQSNENDGNENDNPSPQKDSSPSSYSNSQMFHLSYSASNGSPFSPLYNLPNISPYPTPIIRGGGRNDFASSSAYQSEDTVDTPFRALHLYSPRIDDDSHIDTNLHSHLATQRGSRPRAQKQHSPDRDILAFTLQTTEFEMKMASELERIQPVGSLYEDPLNVMMTRFQEISAKEKYQSEEISKAVHRLSAMNTVEAEKRDVLFRQFEEQDAQAKAEVKRLKKREEERLRAAQIEKNNVEMRLLQEEKARDEAKETARIAKELSADNALKALQIEKQKQEQGAKAPPSGPAVGSQIITASSTNVISKIYDLLPYVRDAHSLVRWLEKSEERVHTAPLPEEIMVYLRQLESQLLSFGSQPMVNENAMDGDHSNSNSNIVGNNIKGMLSITSMAQKLLRVGASLGGDAFLCVLCRLLRAAVGCVCQGTKPANVTLLGNVIVGMFLVLPSEPTSKGGQGGMEDSTGGGQSGQSLQQQGAIVFKAMLYGESELCVPHVERGSKGDDLNRQRRRVAAVELLGALIGTQSKSSPVSVEEGWTWLIRLGKQLTHAVERRKSGDTSVTSLQCQECCTALFLYLRQGSAAVIARFGWPTVLNALKTVRTVISDKSDINGTGKGISESEACKQLVNWIDSAISSEGVKCAEKLKHHEPHVMASYMIISSVEEARLESEQVDKDKGGIIMQKIKQLRINSIPGIFNRLSATSASQSLVVNQLLEKIVAASKETPEVLRYTLCKIAAQLVAQAQSEFFIIEDESQSIPIARVAVGLCQSKPELADVIKAEYFRISPLTVPRQAEGGLVGDELYENMGFLRVQGRFEDTDQWQSRMNKVVCAFSVTVIQPEGAPFSLADGWAWLANMINACSRIPSPSAYIADALDIFLRIVSPVMCAAYGVRFVDLLMITEKEILPKLKENSSKIRLTEFLKTVRESRGRTFLPIFKKSQTN